MAVWLIFILLVLLFVPAGLLGLLAVGPLIFVVNFIEVAKDFNMSTWLWIVAGLFVLGGLSKWNEHLREEAEQRKKEKQEKKEFMRNHKNRIEWMRELDETKKK